MPTTKKTGTTGKSSIQNKAASGTKAPTTPKGSTAARSGASSDASDTSKRESAKLGQPTTAKPSADRAYTARDLAKDVGLPTASVARRYLRSTKVPKPSKGWVWADKTAAKPAIEAVRKATKAALA